MATYKVTIKEAVDDWNKKNPEKKQKTLVSLAEEIGTSSQVLSQLGVRHSKNFNKHCEVIFQREDYETINSMWTYFTTINIIILNRLEKIRIALGCNIWDLICKVI